MKLIVECYSGYKGNERPQRFAIDGIWHEVMDIPDRWYGAEYSYFKVHDEEDNIYILRYDEEQDEWDFTFFARRN